MASRGVTKSGAVFCLECGTATHRKADKCPSCSAAFTGDVVAFQCPRCHRTMRIGTGQCPQCGQKFKLKAVKPPPEPVRPPPGPPTDDGLLVKLMQMGKKPAASELASEPPPPEETEAEERRPAAPAHPSSPNLERFSILRKSIEDLVANRARMLKNMEERLESERKRLAQISSIKDDAAASAQAEAEILALADEMADMTMLQAHIEALADEISGLMTSGELGLSDTARERGLAAKALKTRLEHKEKELAELKAREEQLAAREGMVDRKIKAYASKKKQLDEQEADLRARLQKVELERGELEKLRAEATQASGEKAVKAVESKWLEERKRLKEKVANLHSLVCQGEEGAAEKEIAAAEEDIERLISTLEARLRKVVQERVGLQHKISKAEAIDDDMKRLLKILDQMLGQLPSEVIERFAKSDEFEIYERVLDKFNV